MTKIWNVTKSELINAFNVFSTRKDWSISEKTGREHNFYVLEMPEWVNVVAVTPREEIVLIRQFRHGTRTVTLEIPGGMVDPGETPLEAARRELVEETGYGTENWHLLGTVHPNPAIQDNSCYTYLATGAVKISEQQTEGTEDIEVFTAPVSETDKMVLEGKITHSLVIAALYWYSLRKRPSLPTVYRTKPS